MYSVFKVGDLIRHSALSGKLNRGYGIVLIIMPMKIKCAWTNGDESWIHPGQLSLVARGQDGKLS